jgi:hypothetical protein
MTLEFGDTEAYRAFHARYPNFEGAFDRLVVLTNKCFSRPLENRTALRDVCFSIGETCRDEFADIIFLGVNGHGTAAMKLIRGLYERAVTLAYIIKHPTKAKRYLHYTAINEHRLIQAARKVFSDADIEKGGQAGLVDRVIKNYDKYRPEFLRGKRVAPSWDIPFAEQVEDVGDLDLSRFLRQTVKTQNPFEWRIELWDCLVGSSQKSSNWPPHVGWNKGFR